MRQADFLAIVVWLLLVAVWVLLGLLAGKATREKGYGVREGLLPSLFFSPIIGLLYAAALPDRGPPVPKAPSRSPRVAAARAQDITP